MRVTRLARLEHGVVRPRILPTFERLDVVKRGDFLGVRHYHVRLARHGSSPTFEVANDGREAATVVSRASNSTKRSLKGNISNDRCDSTKRKAW